MQIVFQENYLKLVACFLIKSLIWRINKLSWDCVYMYGEALSDLLRRKKSDIYNEDKQISGTVLHYDSFWLKHWWIVEVSGTDGLLLQSVIQARAWKHYWKWPQANSIS